MLNREREGRCGSDDLVVVSGAQGELHSEEDKDRPLQRELDRDERLALATCLHVTG